MVDSSNENLILKLNENIQQLETHGKIFGLDKKNFVNINNSK